MQRPDLATMTRDELEAYTAHLLAAVEEARTPWFDPLAPPQPAPEVPHYEDASDTPAEYLRAPFTWFGGKRRAAELVWALIGTGEDAPRCYVEPFAGSLAVLLARPDWGGPRIETVNDKDAALALVWRSIQADPDAVAHFANWPVNEADLHARHRWIIQRLKDCEAQVKADPIYTDAQFAGWWLWGINCWIGQGWGVERRKVKAQEGDGGDPHKLNLTTDGTGVHRRSLGGQLPYLHGDDAGRGTNRAVPIVGQREALGNVARGHEARRIVMAGHMSGHGGHRARLSDPYAQIPNITPTGSRIGTHKASLGTMEGRTVDPIYGLTAWMRALAARLRRVRVACGDWSRVVTGAVLLGDTEGHQRAGVFLDPPYDKALRHKDCYREDAHGVAADVRAWCAGNGANPRLRIVLAGYEGEHNALEALGWRKYEWRAHGGFGLAGQGRGRSNRDLERLWASPACLNPYPDGDNAAQPQRAQLTLWQP